MPELPEIETIRKSLDEVIPGKIFSAVEINEPKQFIGDPQKIIGKKVSSLQRKGKVLTLVIENNLFLSFHLKLTGQILYAPNSEHAVFENSIPLAGTDTMPAKVTRVVLKFSDDSALYFNDLRKFGWVRLTDKMEDNGSVDILSPQFTLEYFTKYVSSSRKPIKVLLLDQDKITGIGNIYDNDSLWQAQIHPERKANSLSEEEQKKLYTSVKEIIAEGITYKGSSAQDEMYVLPNSEKGQYQNHFKVYHREGKPCLRCGTTVQRIKQGGRSSFFCPQCQKI